MLFACSTDLPLSGPAPVVAQSTTLPSVAPRGWVGPESSLYGEALRASGLGEVSSRGRSFRVRWIDGVDPSIRGSLAALKMTEVRWDSPKSIHLTRPQLVLVSSYPRRRSDSDQQHLHRVVLLHPDGIARATEIRFAKWGEPPTQAGLDALAGLLKRYPPLPRGLNPSVGEQGQ